MSEPTWSQVAAVCPYCKHVNNPSDSEGTLYDESTDTYDCGSCEREFGVSVFISYSWTCSPIGDATDDPPQPPAPAPGNKES